MEAQRVLDQSARHRMPYPAPRHPLATNGFKVNLPDSVEVIVREMLSPSDVRAERERLREHWFVHWMDGKLYHLRLKGGGPNVEGAPKTLRTSEHPWLLRSRLDDAIGEALPKYEAIRERPFTFLAQKSELIKRLRQQPISPILSWRDLRSRQNLRSTRRYMSPQMERPAWGYSLPSACTMTLTRQF
jgi:hypothetical protein